MWDIISIKMPSDGTDTMYMAANELLTQINVILIIVTIMEIFSVHTSQGFLSATELTLHTRSDVIYMNMDNNLWQIKSTCSCFVQGG